MKSVLMVAGPLLALNAAPGTPIKPGSETAMTIASLFVHTTHLPAVPKVVHKLIASLGRDDVSVAEIAAELSADPVLSAKVLRLANSAYFRLSHRVGSVDDALQVLGFQLVRNLVLGMGVLGAFRSVAGIDLPAFARYSVHSACAARWLTHAAELDAEVGFIVGLTHGLGQLVLHTALPLQMVQLDRDVHPLAGARAAAERAVLGYHHGDVAAELARRWNFPSAVSVALAAVPDPLAAATPLPLAAWVHLATWRARAELFRWSGGQIQAELPLAVARSLDRSGDWLLASAGMAPGGQPAPLPPLATLTQGLESMLA
jgi:HD-like signal output (HDOD) protein